MKKDTNKPFTTDGCSGGMTLFWNYFFLENPPWNDFCIQHDKVYWKDGYDNDSRPEADQRKDADNRLRKRVAAIGYVKTSWIIYFAVRIGGHPLLPFPWRWVYGYKYPRFYDTDT